MVEREALLALAERCEKATGPSYGLNEAICKATAGPNGNYAYRDYTASLDAAVSLVPEGWDFTVQTNFRKGNARASCDATQVAPFDPEDWKVKTARAAAPALALTAAALRARAAQGNPQ